MLSRLRHRFLRRLAAPEDLAERLRIETVLAAARVFLTITSLIAVYLDPTEPTRYAALAYGILIAYSVWAAYVWVYVNRSEDLGQFRRVVHVLDIAFPMSFILFTAGPNSPFFVFLLFVLTAAAFRWGFPETIVTAVVLDVLLIFEGALLSYGPQKGWLEGEYELNRFIIRIGYLITLAVLVGYLGEEEKQWRAENATLNRLLSNVHAENGMRASMQWVLSEATRIFGASRALLVLKQTATGRVYLWRMARAEKADNIVHASEVEAEVRSKYEFALPAHALYGMKGSTRWRCWGVTLDGRKAKLPSNFDPSTLPEMNGVGLAGTPETAKGTSGVLAVTLNVGEEWSGCLFLYDAVTGFEVYGELRFLQNLMRQIGPALYTVFLVRRLRSRAGAIERARVARELHDGAIQALISVEMQVDVLRRQLSSPDKVMRVSGGLSHVQDLLRHQIFELRMLMQQMRPVELAPGQLLDYMADMVDRFRRDTGIGAQFVTTLEEVQLSSRSARELARILQEALVNIRKHSGASNVQVRFAAEDGCWKLGIVDNGRGFDFSGKLSLKELDAARRGPGIIRERVRSLGGDLILQSQPGSGSELTITVPQKSQLTYV